METIVKYFPNLDEKAISRLSMLKALYEDWNQKINVISRKDLDEFYIRHVLHSLAIQKIIQFEAGTQILDVGTGGGFPGIPLAILNPETNFLLVDSIGKKIKVVQAVAEELDLQNLKAIHGRAEEVEQKFDFVVSRAVTHVDRFLPWVKGKLNSKSFNSLENGYLFLKGGDLKEEFQHLAKTYTEFRIQDFFTEEFFETKKVIYLPG